LTEIYLADLDAIAGSQPAWRVYGELLGLGAALWVDAGVADLARASQLAVRSAWPVLSDAGGRGAGELARLVIGLESLPDADLLGALVDRVGPKRLALSIDLRAGRPLAADARWRQASPLEIAEEALRRGVRSLIVLDLACVGEGRGPGVGPLCSAIRRLDDQIELVAGGGVRGTDDLHALAEAGCDAALVASALHDGRLMASDLAPFAK
jgi:phosphoribosylformimino-5-aminoimidazole carboxamide ribotide isomerase